MIKSREEKKASENIKFRFWPTKKEQDWCADINSAIRPSMSEMLQQIWEKSMPAISLKCFCQNLSLGAIQPPALLLGNILKDDIRPKSFPRKGTNLKTSVKICKSNICSKLFLWTLWEAQYSYNNTVKSCSSMVPNILSRRKTIRIVKKSNPPEKLVFRSARTS